MTQQALLVIYRSRNGRDNWEPVLPDDVPAWVKAPDIMGRLVQGEQCMDAGERPNGSMWYRAKRVVNQYDQGVIDGALSTIH